MKHSLVTFLSIFLLCIGIVQPSKAQNNIVPRDEKATSKNKQESNFTGKVSVKMYTDAQNGLNCSLGSVTFQAGARTNWHVHPGGQILLITEGFAYYQEKGKPKRIVHIGETITCLANVEHWHGASPKGSMTHMTVGPNSDQGSVIWHGKVSDEVYLGNK
jgi:4-carboxymuconolactone decarboxylase